MVGNTIIILNADLHRYPIGLSTLVDVLRRKNSATRERAAMKMLNLLCGEHCPFPLLSSVSYHPRIYTHNYSINSYDSAPSMPDCWTVELVIDTLNKAIEGFCSR